METYPKAAIAMDNGDLVQVTNFSINANNNAKMKSTLRRRNSGVVIGNFEGQITFDMEISESGMERDYFTLVSTGRLKQVRVKLPGGLTLVCEGAYQQIQGEQPADDAFKASLTFICGVKKAS